MDKEEKIKDKHWLDTFFRDYVELTCKYCEEIEEHNVKMNLSDANYEHNWKIFVYNGNSSKQEIIDNLNGIMNDETESG